MSQTIDEDDPELSFKNEEEFLRDVSYRGVPFTGLLKGRSQTTEFVNGNAHGLHLEYYKSGELGIRAAYHNGEEVESTTYHRSGQVKILQTQTQWEYWTEDGILLRESANGLTRCYFRDGKLSLLYSEEEKRTTYFSKSGTQAYSNPPPAYQTEVLLEGYRDLFAPEYPNLRVPQNLQLEENQRVHLLWMWLWEVFDRDVESYADLVRNLMVHPSRDVVLTMANIIAHNDLDDLVGPPTPENRECFEEIARRRRDLNATYPERIRRRPGNR